MNLSLLGPTLIVPATVVIVIIAAFAWLYMRGVMTGLRKTTKEDLTTAFLANDGIAQAQPDGSKQVKGQEAETLDNAATVSKPMPLFSASGDGRVPSAVEQGTD
jgi:hypothetical protein